MKDFRDLQVWQKSHKLTLAVYRATATFPQDEVYGLRIQIRRSCVSVPTNIAEGCGRSGDRDMGRFLQIAMGSASESEYQILLTRELSLLDAGVYESLARGVVEVKRMLASFIRKLKADR